MTQVRIGDAVRPDPRATAIFDQCYRVQRRPYERAVAEMRELARLGATQRVLVQTAPSTWPASAVQPAELAGLHG